mmetsp:Transcript_25394/g.61164  ORF Transcript_25394/g.61164 Transcript_25394/m.61164 type:complete len:614 (-) Transcript_25394:443-2284(-)
MEMPRRLPCASHLFLCSSGDRHRRLPPLLSLLLLPLVTGDTVAGDNLTVATTEGPVRGHYVPSYLSGQVREFLGIPFARPPIGSLRFAAPAPPLTRKEVYEANFTAPMCPQNVTAPAGEVSEDCLYLSIWTPPAPPAELLPIYVWIYGGTFIFGSGAGYGSGSVEGSKIYNGKLFALEENGIIVVTFNYRLGAFGFLKGANLQGNYGLDDQLQVLKWVQTNIKAFGGDPSRVTIGGQSAGAQSVLAHLSSPRSRPYFSQAIMESAPLGLPFHTNETAAVVARDFATSLGCSEGDVACFRSKSMGEVLNAQSAAEAEDFDFFEIFRDYEAYNPTVTGPLDVEPGALPAQPFLALSNVSEYTPSEAKPLLAGSNLNDALMFVDALFFLPLGPAVSNILNYGLYGALDGLDVNRHYPYTPLDGRRGLSRAQTDMLFYCSLRNMTRGGPYTIGKSPNAYLYRFDHVPSFSNGSSIGATCKKGACHGDELRFVFDYYNGVHVTAAEVKLGAAMQNYWMNFIRTGDPNESGIPTKGAPAVPWPAYDAADDAVLVFGGEGCGHTGCGIRQASPEENKHCNDVWDNIGYLRRHERKLKEFLDGETYQLLKQKLRQAPKGST